MKWMLNVENIKKEWNAYLSHISHLLPCYHRTDQNFFVNLATNETTKMPCLQIEFKINRQTWFMNCMFNNFRNVRRTQKQALNIFWIKYVNNLTLKAILFNIHFLSFPHIEYFVTIQLKSILWFSSCLFLSLHYILPQRCK